MQKQYKLTQERLDELKAELEHLKTVREHEVAELIKEARGFGDLSENSEYDEAKNEQGKLYSRIAELEAIIPNAVVIDESMNNDKAAHIGSTVKVADKNGKEIEFTLVGTQETSLKTTPIRLSDESPYGKAVLGHHVDETVVVEAPSGNLELRIVSITR